jgi:hypothetical protein
MKTNRLDALRTAALALLCATPVGAQALQTTGPFTGTTSEGFETDPGTTFQPCVVGRVFNNKGDLCTPLGSGAHLTGGWSFACSISARSGSWLYGSGGASNGPCEYTFDQPVYKFGGYFGVNNGTAGGTAVFYDTSGGLMGSFPINAPADCSWNWNGWEVTGTTGIQRVEIISNYSVGNYMQMDDMEIDEVLPFELSGSPDSVSVTGGGSQVLTMDVGLGFAGKSYIIIGSASGTTPGITYVGINVPLNFDGYFNFTFLNPNSPILNGSGGVLNSLGQTTAVFTLPPLSDPALIGLTVNHAGTVLDLVGGSPSLVHATNAAPVMLIP